jgi:hypothetical protein
MGKWCKTAIPLAPANRVNALSTRSGRAFPEDGLTESDAHSYGTSDQTNFQSACEPAVREPSSPWEPDCDLSTKCCPEPVGDNLCNQECQSTACFHDGGHCRWRHFGEVRKTKEFFSCTTPNQNTSYDNFRTSWMYANDEDF